MLLFNLLSPPPTVVALPAAPGPVTNPLKGYAPYVDDAPKTDVPFTMAYHYATWRELEPKEGEYAFEAWEAKNLRSGPTQNRRAIIRVQMDYPSQPTGVPQWLLDTGLKTTPYTDYGGGRAPDYADPRLREGLKRLIAAMGLRWNDNPQVGYVQLGLLGFWGEWHTYPRTELFAPPAVQKEVVDAMRAAFPDKPLLARNALDYPGQQGWLGFHDDMIPQDTLGPEEWAFWPTIRRAGRTENWKVAPTGGEMVPGEAKRYLGKEWELTKRAVREAHLTWIGPYGPTLAASDDPDYRKRAAELSRMLGYEFRLTRLTVDGKKLELEGVNQGVAPFYGRWPLRFAVLDAKGAVLASVEPKVDVRRWLPGRFSVAATLPADAPAIDAAHPLAVGLVDPWVGKPRVQFANRLPVLDGWTVLMPSKS